MQPWECLENTAVKVPSHGCRKTQTRCISDEWKRIRKMCPLARTYMKRKRRLRFPAGMGRYLYFQTKTIQKNILETTDSVRCVVGGRCQAITQVKQLFAGSVLGWMVAACTSKHWAGGHFSETVRLGTDSVKWPTVSIQVFLRTVED